MKVSPGDQSSKRQPVKMARKTGGLMAINDANAGIGSILKSLTIFIISGIVFNHDH